MITETANTACTKTDAAVDFSVLRRGTSVNCFGYAWCLVTLLQLHSPGFHCFVRILQNPAALLLNATASCSISFFCAPFLPGAAFRCFTLYSELAVRSHSPASASRVSAERQWQGRVLSPGKAQLSLGKFSS